MPRHKIDAQDWTDHAERISDRVADRWIAVLHDIQRRLKGRGTSHRTSEHAERMANFDVERLAECERHHKAGDYSNKRQHIGFYAGGAGHACEKLPPVQNADP